MNRNMAQLQRSSKVKVGYQNIDIVHEKASFSKPSDAYGEFDHRKNSISIQEDLTKIDYACTLLHEILHAVVYYNSLTQSGQPLDNENKEETVVENEPDPKEENISDSSEPEKLEVQSEDSQIEDPPETKDNADKNENSTSPVES